MNRKTMDIHTLTGVAIFTAIVIVLQMLGSFIRFGPFSISLTLIPIVVGAALYGPGAGAWLGFVFSMVVLISGDAAPFMTVNVLGTILTVIVKGTAAGFLAGVVFRALEKKNTWLFLVGCKLFFMETITGWGQAMGFESVGKYLIYGLVGGNFLFEVLTNIIHSPVILRLIRIGRKEKA